MRTLGLFYKVVSRDRLLIVCATYLIALVLVAFIGIRFTGYNYDDISDASLEQPSWKHLFGTDVNGHDLLTQTLFGAQISLLVAAVGALVSLTMGVTYGMISGYVGGRTDNIMMRIVEIIYSLPTLVIVIVMVTTLDKPVSTALRHLDFTFLSPRLILIVLFLGLTEWLTMARIIRGQVLVLKQQAFIQASLALGQSHIAILWRHLLPNLAGIIIVYLTLTIPAVMLAESFMSFLGVGIEAPQTSWGKLSSDAASLINPITFYWWMLVFPGGMMALTLLALNFLGDGLRDALDPRVRK